MQSFCRYSDHNGSATVQRARWRWARGRPARFPSPAISDRHDPTQRPGGAPRASRPRSPAPPTNPPPPATPHRGAGGERRALAALFLRPRPRLAARRHRRLARVRARPRRREPDLRGLAVALEEELGVAALVLGALHGVARG